MEFGRKIYISENTLKRLWLPLMLEGSRDKLLSPYLPFVQRANPQATLSTLKQFLLAKFVNEGLMRSLSEGGNYYLCGVARYYFNGDLTTNKRLNAIYPNVKDRFNAEVCERLNALIGILRNSYIDTVGKEFEQPEDFGTLPIDKLLRKYRKKIDDALGLNKPKEVEKPKASNDYTTPNGYTYEVITSYEECTKYNKATEPGAWCITYGEQHYNGYVKRNRGHFIIFCKKGFESIPRRKGQGFPLDEYGLSMLAVVQSDKSTNILQVTSRWNHGTGIDNTSVNNADHVMNKDELLQVIGGDETLLQRIFEQWQEKVKLNGNSTPSRKEKIREKLNVLRTFKYFQMQLNNGQDPRNISGFRNARLIIGNPETAKFNKSLVILRLSIGENIWSAICDRGQINFDTIYKDSGWGNASFMKLNKLDNLLKIEDDDSNKFMLYDVPARKLIELDGKKKFTNLLSNGRLQFYTILLSGHQLALMDKSTNKPIVLPNGSVWCEKIAAMGSYMSRSQSNEVIEDDNNFLVMVYDSASGESYLYDLVNKTFAPIDTTNIETIDNISKRFMRFRFTTPRDELYGTARVLDLETMQWVEINGQSEFKRSQVLANNEGLLLFSPKDKEMSKCVYNFNVGKFVTQEDGQPLVVTDALFLKKDWVQFRYYKKGNYALGGEGCFYHTKTDEFYHFEEQGGDIWFKLPVYKNILADGKNYGRQLIGCEVRLLNGELAKAIFN